MPDESPCIRYLYSLIVDRTFQIKNPHRGDIIVKSYYNSFKNTHFLYTRNTCGHNCMDRGLCTAVGTMRNTSVVINRPKNVTTK